MTGPDVLYNHSWPNMKDVYSIIPMEYNLHTYINDSSNQTHKQGKYWYRVFIMTSKRSDFVCLSYNLKNCKTVLPLMVKYYSIIFPLLKGQ